MLNPHQVSELRAQVERDPSSSEAAGFHIQRRKISVEGAQWGPVQLVREAGSITRMHGPERIFGRPHDPTCLSGVSERTVVEPEKLVWKLEDVTLVGNNALLCDEGLYVAGPIFNEEQYDKVEELNRRNHQGFVLKTSSETGDRLAYFVSSPRPNCIFGAGVFFGNVEPNNYGSFLFRVLPQLLLWAEIGEDCDFYLTAGRTSWFQEALNLVSLPSRPVFAVAEVVGDRFEALTAFSDFCVEGWIDQQTRRRIQALVDRIARKRTGVARSLRRLYVSRLLGGGARPHYRRLLNEQELAAQAAELGYETIFPETLAFEEQIAIFSEAQRVVGPSGSGMLNSLFCDPGIRVLDMESHHDTVRQHARLYSSTRKVYSFLFGEIKHERPNVAFSDWTVDGGLFRRSISEFE